MIGGRQGQTVQANSTAYQAGSSLTVINNNGLSEQAVLALIKDQVSSQLAELRGEAIAKAQARGDVITERYVTRLAREYPAGLAQAGDPDFQYAIATVQKEYMRCGDDELGDLLVDLLIDRSKQTARNILQIVLNESLAVAPKLTLAQTSLLSLMYVLRYTGNQGVRDSATFAAYLEEHVRPFCELNMLATQESSFQHLQFAGCGTLSALGMGTSIEAIFRQNYAGIFARGFDAPEVSAMGLSDGVAAVLICPALNDDGKSQIAALNSRVLEEKLTSTNATQAERDTINVKFESSRMGEQEIRELTLKVAPWMSILFDRWRTTSLSSFMLSSVGIAIGHAKIKSIIKRDFGDLSIWIN